MRFKGDHLTQRSCHTEKIFSIFLSVWSCYVEALSELCRNRYCVTVPFLTKGRISALTYHVKIDIAWQYPFWRTDIFFIFESASLTDLWASLFGIEFEKRCTKNIFYSSVCILRSRFVLVNKLCPNCKRCSSYAGFRIEIFDFALSANP